MRLEDIDYPVIAPNRQAQAAIDALQGELDPRWGGRPELRPRDALVVLQYEAFLAWVTIQNFLNGEELSDAAIDRLTLASSRIDTISRIASS